MVRLVAAVEALADTRDALATATRAANEFWSAVGHIGTQDDSEPSDGTQDDTSRPTASRPTRAVRHRAVRQRAVGCRGGDVVSAATVVILAVLVGAVLWSWQRGSRGLAVVFALVAACPPRHWRRRCPGPRSW